MLVLNFLALFAVHIRNGLLIACCLLIVINMLFHEDVIFFTACSRCFLNSSMFAGWENPGGSVGELLLFDQLFLGAPLCLEAQGLAGFLLQSTAPCLQHCQTGFPTLWYLFFCQFFHPYQHGFPSPPLLFTATFPCPSVLFPPL